MITAKFDTEWETKAYDKAVEAIKTLIDVASTMGGSKSVVSGMLGAFITSHRTLQQSCIRNFVEMLKKWGDGKESDFADFRNKEAWKFAQEVRKLDPIFPHI